jgi:hypothetical protein
MEYKPQNVTCQSCNSSFTVEPDDFSFYEKIQVPPPTFCPECRMLRRMSFSNYHNFYKTNCDACQMPTIGTYRQDRPYRMFCNPCWWKDNWDGTEYGINYNPDMHFFEHLKELRDKSVFMALETLYPSLTNTVYTNHSGYQKNCFMTICADFNENCAYSTMIAGSKDSLDCYRLVESELCYECVGVFKSYSCYFSEELENCVNCHFCQSCYGCTDCFGCVNLRNKSYYFFNKQYSKEEYFEKIKDLNFNLFSNQQKIKEESEGFWLKFPKRSYHGNSLNIDVSGEYIYESKNTKNSYLVKGAENCKFVQILSLKTTKDTYDFTQWGNGVELCYECNVVGEGAYHNKFCVECWPECRDLEYCFYCINCRDCFGCVNLKKKQYCIFNREYSKEEYFKLKEQIINKMKEKPWKNKAGHSYSYGEFFPPEISPFSYQEAVSFEYKILDDKEALKKGYNWVPIPEKEYQVTIKHKDLPEDIKETKDDIVNEVISCSTCSRAFNISQIEFDLLKKIDQPIPHSCPKCRHARRLTRINKPKFYERNCFLCKANINTPYASERPEIVYCESCYQKETN